MAELPLPARLALVFSPAPRRAALEALYAIDAEIGAAGRAGIEHAVAHLKLDWWRGEVDRLAAGRPEHPLCRALLAAAGAAPDYARLHERLAAADLALAGFAPATLGELLAWSDRAHGALQRLAAEAVAAARDPALEAFGTQLGRALGAVDRLAAAPAALTPAVLAGCAGEALAGLGAAAPDAHGRVRAALAAAHLARLSRRRGATPPAPLVQLWLAWRAARRAVETPR